MKFPFRVRPSFRDELLVSGSVCKTSSSQDKICNFNPEEKKPSFKHPKKSWFPSFFLEETLQSKKTSGCLCGFDLWQWCPLANESRAIEGILESSHVFLHLKDDIHIRTLPKTNIAPENRPGFKRKLDLNQPSIFRCELFVSGMVYSPGWTLSKRIPVYTKKKGDFGYPWLFWGGVRGTTFIKAELYMIFKEGNIILRLLMDLSLPLSSQITCQLRHGM